MLFYNNLIKLELSFVVVSK